MSVDLDEALVLASASGVDTEQLVVGTTVDEVPPAPSHRWVLVPSSRGGVVIGGMDRGAFASYAEITSTDGLVDALLRLGDQPAPTHPTTRPMREAASTLTQRLLRDHHAQVPLEPGRIPIGTAFDHLGPECGHVLYPLDVPVAYRSVPPTDLEEPRTAYVLARPLPATARLTVAPAWFGQPGGSPLVWLPAVIRWFVDDGTLVRYAPSPAA